MGDLITNKKGVVLVIVLGTILVTVLLANAVIRLISSQSRLTHHQLSRIQAYYATKAAVTYAQEQLRTGAWVAGTNCTVASPCNAANVGLNLANDFRPASMSCPTCGISLIIRADTDPACSSPGVAACITSTSTYTYTP